MKKLIISHRGNISGPNEKTENHPDQIRYAIQQGFYVECDVWYDGSKFALGHDKPQYQVPPEFFYNDRLFIHAKSILTLHKLIKTAAADIFTHDQDLCALTKNGLIWSHYKYKTLITDKSVAVLPELAEDWDISNAYGICTDFPNKYK